MTSYCLNFIDTNPEWHVVGSVFAETDWAVGFRKGEDDIQNYVNDEIRKMYKSGFLVESLKKWWGGQEMEEYITRIHDMFK